MDPNRWEFAHASFLKGQMHLLRWIIRRNSSNLKGGDREGGGRKEEEEEERVVMEVVRMKEEQRKIEEKVQRMWRRVQETESQSQQMLAFLVKVAGDPVMLHRLMGTSEGGKKRASLQLEENRGELEAVLVEVGVGMDGGFQPLSVECGGGLLAVDGVDLFFNAVLHLHVLKISGGHDVVDSLARFTRLWNLGIYIFSYTGAVTNVTLCHPSLPASLAA